jgi:3-dehydroquinate synthase
MTIIRVAHPGADYDVLVGGLGEALPRLEVRSGGHRLPVISDQRVFGLHGDRLAGVVLPDPILVPEGEAAKGWPTLASIVDQLARMDIKRGTPIIALGGGSVGDVAGLAASLFKRGCPIVHVPTTLLAQADSAIGGKTAIDAAGQKNLVGTFHHPLLVIADPTFLDTLDSRQLRTGYAEVVKYGLMDDPDFFAWCEANGDGLLAGNGDRLRTAIEHCVRAKARFVAADPDDTAGTRALLNFGHSFGHAIEAVAGHRVLHGEAVAVGMVFAFAFSVELGLCPAADADRVRAHLQAAGLPARLGDIGLTGRGAAILTAMLTDKKAQASGLTLILARRLGEAFVARNVDLPRLAAFLERQA